MILSSLTTSHVAVDERIYHFCQPSNEDGFNREETVSPFGFYLGAYPGWLLRRDPGLSRGKAFGLPSRIVGQGFEFEHPLRKDVYLIVLMQPRFQPLLFILLLSLALAAGSKAQSFLLSEFGSDADAAIHRGGRANCF